MIDLSDFHEFDSGNHADIITRAMKAFSTVGFIAVKGHGLSDEQLHRQFSLGKLLAAVPEQEKHALHASIKEGSWAGYKVSGFTG